MSPHHLSEQSASHCQTLKLVRSIMVAILLCHMFSMILHSLSSVFLQGTVRAVDALYVLQSHPAH